MELAVGVANIGSFILQTVTLGQCVKNKTDTIEIVLDKARNELHTTMSIIIEYYEIIDDSDIGPIYADYIILKSAVARKLEHSRSKKSFLTTAKTYKSRKRTAAETFNKCRDLRYHAEDVSGLANLQLKIEKKRLKDLGTLPETDELSPERPPLEMLQVEEPVPSLQKTADPFQ